MTDSAHEIAVTGSTGRLGGRVARLLANSGLPQRLLVRDPSRAPRLTDTRVVLASYGDGAAAEEALRGTGTVLMVSGAETPERVQEHTTFIDAAACAGVRHLV
jgi:NAD(P)H dehydrogenase (quinone)